MENNILELLHGVQKVKKPIRRMVRSGEGGDHTVWIIDNAYVVRVPSDVRTMGALTREQDLLSLLKAVNGKWAYIPECLDVGLFGSLKDTAYALYKKVGGVSIEASPGSITEATESGLAVVLQHLRSVAESDARSLGLGDQPHVNPFQLRQKAYNAWSRLYSNNQIKEFLDVDLNEALAISEEVASVYHIPVLLHADIKGEHIFVNSTGQLTGIIDWSDAAIGHPSVDIGGIAISIGAAAAARVGTKAGYSREVVAKGIFLARCNLVILLDKLLNGTDDSPEWLVRIQLKRALELF
jgi:aminoglycoside phosphotransferase (APT) family kinase protein